MPFPPKVQEDALVACGRHCCLCHKFCGIKIELHHIEQKSEGGKDTLENCIPLCFDCHGDMRSYDHKHPKGHKYTPGELQRHRDAWYAKIKGSPSPSYGSAHAALDQGVYLAIVRLLPYAGPMGLLDHHDFGAPFHTSLFDELDRFVTESEAPTMEFIDADLEGMRVALAESVAKFAHYLSLNTWRLGEKMQSVPSEWQDNKPEHFDKVVRTLNAMSTDAVACYKTLVREGRRRLGVDPATAASQEAPSK